MIPAYRSVLSRTVRPLVGFASMLIFAVPIAAASAGEDTLTIHEKGEASDLVVLGKVVKTKSYWKGRLIVTTSDVAVYDVIKGEVDGDELQVTTLGGVVGDVRLRVTHSTQLEEGELAMFFLRDPVERSIAEDGAKEVSVSDGKVPLLAPGFSDVRFRNDRRLQTRIESLTKQITGDKQ